jgi:DNA-binding NtrC family response regulator
MSRSNVAPPTTDIETGRVAAFERRFELAMLEDLAQRSGYGRAWRTLVQAAASHDRQVSVERVRALGWHAVTKQFQRSLLDQALAECDGNVTRAAQHLGIARSHIYNVIADRSDQDRS